MIGSAAEIDDPLVTEFLQARPLAVPAGRNPASRTVIRVMGVPTTTPSGRSINSFSHLLHRCFNLAPGHRAPLTEIRAASVEMLDAVADRGVGEWIALVREHHQGTHQHCLLVCGVAAAFAVALGFRRDDALKLTLAATLHDLGKARVPTEILDKPAKLTPEEREFLKQHPKDGVEMVEATVTLPKEVLDAVEHHHEFLDGSGYYGLRGSEIGDLTRLITIADVYSALIEDRPYRKPYSPEVALTQLVGMAGKLDRDLIRALIDRSSIALGC